MSRTAITGLLPALALALTLGACDQQGPAERTEEAIDNAAEEVKEESAELFEDANDKAEDTEDATTDALDDAGDKLEKCAELGLTDC